MKNILCCIALLSALFLSSQTVSEALLYGQDQNSFGTARYRALSGAFGALGGDLTAVGVNPAGSTVFANHYVSFSTAFDQNNNDGVFNGGNTSEQDLDFSVNQAGIALVFSNPNKKINKFSIAFNYDATRNYDDDTFLSGNSTNSLADFFVNNASGFALDNFELLPNETIPELYQFLGEEFGLAAQQGFLGYQSFLIDPVDPNDLNNIDYVGNTGTGTYNQFIREFSRGYRGKFTFNGALELNNRISFGMNLNVHAIDRERTTDFRETNSNADATIDQALFRDTVITEGAGFSIGLGTLLKVTKSLRLGLAYESPTWYEFNESQRQSLTTSGGGFTDVISPNIVNVYAPYSLRTPGTWTGSLAYVFGKYGLISADVSSKDYTNLKFNSDGSVLFIQNNNFVDRNLQSALTYRIGGELRIKRFTLRGGYLMSESPYSDENLMSDTTGYSLGLGYTWGKTVLDVSFANSQRDYAAQLLGAAPDPSATISNSFTNVVFSLGINL